MNLSTNQSISINPAPDVWPNRSKPTRKRITVFIHREFIGQNFGLQVTGSQVSVSKMNFWKDRFLFDKTMDEVWCKWNQRLNCQRRLALGKSWLEGQRQSTENCLNKGAVRNEPGCKGEKACGTEGWVWLKVRCWLGGLSPGLWRFPREKGSHRRLSRKGVK